MARHLPDPVPHPVPPNVPESFASWCNRQPMPVTGWVHQSVRSLLFHHHGPMQPEDVADACGHVLVPLLQKFEHKTSTWEPPTYRFIEVHLLEYLRKERRQPRQFPTAADSVGPGSVEAYEHTIADHRADQATATAAATAALDGEVAQHLDALRAFDATWRPKETQVLRAMEPSPTKAWIALHLRGWTVEQIADWFGVTKNNVDTNWRSRGNREFKAAWIKSFGEPNWQAYEAARQEAAAARRAIERYESEWNKQEPNDEGQSNQEGQS